MAGRLRVTLVKSPIGHTARTRGTLRAMGLRRVGQTIEIDDTAQMRGMARTVRFLLQTEELAGTAGKTNAGSGPAARTEPATEAKPATKAKPATEAKPARKAESATEPAVASETKSAADSKTEKAADGEPKPQARPRRTRKKEEDQ
jgi:large subunit ribosomal protein L30